MKTRNEQECGEQTMYSGAWKIDIFYLHVSCSAHQVLTSVLRFLLPYFVLTCRTPFYILYLSSLMFSMQLFPLQSLCSMLGSFTPYCVVCALVSTAHAPSPSSPLHFPVSLMFPCFILFYIHRSPYLRVPSLCSLLPRSALHTPYTLCILPFVPHAPLTVFSIPSSVLHTSYSVHQFPSIPHSPNPTHPVSLYNCILYSFPSTEHTVPSTSSPPTLSSVLILKTLFCIVCSPSCMFYLPHSPSYSPAPDFVPILHSYTVWPVCHMVH